MNEENAIVEQKPARPAVIKMGAQGVQLQTLEDAWRFSNYIVAAKLCPKGLETPEAVVVALQLGAEVGLTPMASMQNIAVINGRPTIWGDSQLAICRATGQVEAFEEWYEEGGQRIRGNPVKYADDTAAFVRCKRTGYDERVESFSVADAKRAQLWGKQGPWSQYPARMLRSRSRSFVLRDLFGDALKGIMSCEEARDIPPERDINAHVEVGPAPGSKASGLRARLATQDAPKPAPATTPVVASEPQTAIVMPPDAEKPRGESAESVPPEKKPVGDMTKVELLAEIEIHKTEDANTWLDAFDQFGTGGVSMPRHSVEQLRAMAEYCRRNGKNRWLSTAGGTGRTQRLDR
jgi:hypothetical protein